MNAKPETIAQHFLDNPHLLPKFIEIMNQEGEKLLRLIPDDEKVEVKHHEFNNLEGYDQIKTKRDFDLTINFNGKPKFYIYGRNEHLEIVGYNSALKIFPTASNRFRVMEEKGTNRVLRVALRKAANQAYHDEIVSTGMEKLDIGTGQEYASKEDWIECRIDHWMEG